MILQIISDIHLEFNKLENSLQKIYKSSPSNKNTILLLCGDIGIPSSKEYFFFLTNVSREFKTVLIIAGNHEFYNGKDMENTLKDIKEVCECFDNIIFLNNTKVEIEDYIFFGTTLWSNIPKEASLKVKTSTNDFRNIKDLTVDKVNTMNKIAIKSLEDTVLFCKENNKKLIVLSHHLPSFLCIDEKYRDKGDLNHAYANNLDYLLNDPIIFWFFGHTHSSINKCINNVNLICNPYGYDVFGVSENSKYGNDFVIKL